MLPEIKYTLNKHNIKPKIPSGASNTNTCKLNINKPSTNNIMHKYI